VSPRPDPHSEEAGEPEYGNDTGFATEATREPDPAGTGSPDSRSDQAPAAPGEPPDQRLPPSRISGRR
jgi:hypothetical protein